MVSICSFLNGRDALTLAGWGVFCYIGDMSLSELAAQFVGDVAISELIEKNDPIDFH